MPLDVQRAFRAHGSQERLAEVWKMSAALDVVVVALLVITLALAIGVLVTAVRGSKRVP